jgi:hypothetical protein
MSYPKSNDNFLDELDCGLKRAFSITRNHHHIYARSNIHADLFEAYRGIAERQGGFFIVDYLAAIKDRQD